MSTMTRREAERILEAEEAYEVMQERDCIDAFRSLYEAKEWVGALRKAGITGLYIRTILIDEQGNAVGTPCQRFRAIRVLAQTKP